MKKKRILVVEDEPIIAEDLKITLQMIGYEVVGTVASGERAADAVSALSPDAVLMDIVLGSGSDGIESSRQILQNCDVPIVYLTAHADKATFERAQETYPYGYLVKPVGTSELFSSIETAIHRHQLEKKLKESEHRYRLLSELVSDGASSVRIEPDGGFSLEWSTNYFRAKLGYSSGDLSSLEGWARIVHRDDMPLFFRCIDLLRRGEQVSEDFRLIAGGGDIRWIHATIYPEWDAFQHRLCRIITAIQDITGRKKAEEALRKNEERLKTVADRMREIICQVDRDGIVTYLSPSNQGITGFTQAERIGRHLFDRVHPEDLPSALEYFGKAVSTRSTGIMRFRSMHRDGHYMRMETDGTILVDGCGEVCGGVFMLRESGGPVETNERLDRMESLFESLAGNVPGIVYRIDLLHGHEINFFNGMLFGMTGYTPEELSPGAACCLEPHIHEADRPRVASAVREALRNKSPFEVEYRFECKDGTIRHFLERGRPVCDAGGDALFMDGVILDLSAYAHVAGVD